MGMLPPNLRTVIDSDTPKQTLTEMLFQKTGSWGGWAGFTRNKGLDEHTFMFVSLVSSIFCL